MAVKPGKKSIPHKQTKCYNVFVPYVALVLSALVAAFGFAHSRFTGFGVAALGAMATAYFLMAPVGSLRVTQVSDLLALSAYCIVGGIVLPFARPRGRISNWRAPASTTAVATIETHLKSTIEELSFRPELRDRLTAANIDVDPELTVRCTTGDASHILSDIFSLVLAGPQVSRISIDACQLPGRDLVFVAAHRVWPSPPLEAITIGKRAQDCQPIPLSTWPHGWRATWFDNGYADIYQVSISSAPFGLIGEVD